MTSYQIEYLTIWREAFAKLFDWSDDETMSWAGPLLDGMDPPGMVINEPPLFYVAREIAWRQLDYDDLSQTSRWDLIRAIQSILSPDHGRSFPPGLDFDEAKRQIELLLRRARLE